MTTWTPLRRLRAHDHNFQIKVRAVRVWRPKVYDSDLYDGEHYILVDEQGDALHARLDENSYKYVPQRMERGEVYDIFRFSTPMGPERQRLVDDRMMLKFTASTVFKKVTRPCPEIPQYSFRLIQFNDLITEIKNKSPILADVYGCIKKVIPVHRTSVKDNTAIESKCEITIENLRREKLRITFWAHIARSFDLDVVVNSTPPALAVFTSLKLSEFGVPVATNSDHTCVIMDPAIPDRESYKAEFCKPGDRVEIQPPPSQCQTSEERNRQAKTVAELNAINSEDYKSKNVFCKASILRFPDHNGWWYRGCSHSYCYRQLIKQDDSNNYVCKQHGLQTPTPYYRIYMTIKQEDDETTVTLMGKQAIQLFNSNCKELVEKRSYPTEQTIPEEIDNTIGGMYLFELKVKWNNELVVVNIFPDPDSVQFPTDQPPTMETPACLQSEKKRRTERNGKASFQSEPHKKNKSKAVATASPSSQLWQEEGKHKID